ncbi:MAG: hypothetical protein HY709_08720 [Candidatus Latescibacteria bacterium]|nr:hypothetical protein [Candidatus Latescibacterota bacterium]
MKLNLKIIRVETHRVIVPFVALFHHDAHGVGGYGMGPTFTVLHTDAGVTGVGEGAPPPPELLIGENPFCLSQITFKLRETPAWPAVEMACLDIQGKMLNLPVCKLLNGEDIRPRVPHSAYCFFRIPNVEGEYGVSPENYVAYCQDLIARFGFTCLKLKMGAYPPEVDVELVHQVRQAVGEKVALRMDVNGAWSHSTALMAVKRLEDCNLEYLEDPLCQYRGYDYPGMHLLRQRTLTPIAADGHYRLRDLVQIVRHQAADVVLGDISYGIDNLQRYYRMATEFNVGLSMHSGYEMGVKIAARAHVAAATPGLHHPIDMHYHHLTDDVIKGGMHRIEGGCVTVGDAPGLGVELDPEQLERYRWTPERQAECEQIRQQLIEEHRVIPKDRWARDPARYPYY